MLSSEVCRRRGKSGRTQNKAKHLMSRGSPSAIKVAVMSTHMNALQALSWTLVDSERWIDQQQS